MLGLGHFAFSTQKEIAQSHHLCISISLAHTTGKQAGMRGGLGGGGGRTWSPRGSSSGGGRGSFIGRGSGRGGGGRGGSERRVLGGGGGGGGISLERFAGGKRWTGSDKITKSKCGWRIVKERREGGVGGVWSACLLAPSLQTHLTSPPFPRPFTVSAWLPSIHFVSITHTVTSHVT